MEEAVGGTDAEMGEAGDERGSGERVEETEGTPLSIVETGEGVGERVMGSKADALTQDEGLLLETVPAGPSEKKKA